MEKTQLYITQLYITESYIKRVRLRAEDVLIDKSRNMSLN